MAIYNGRILMRKGNEADFDPSKLMSGEWAVSLDAGIVRICLEAGKVIRMATYEAFEEDMKQIEAILLECQSIEEAVRRINTEVSEKLNACAEYVQQAKGYSEQAKTSEANAKSYMQSAKTSEENAKVSETNAKASENSAKESENSAKLTEERAREVFESIPEDYSTISNDLYELAIKETASGEEIHVNDSSNLKLREFALYGKAKQNTTSGNQLLDFTEGYTETKNGITVSVENGKVKVSGTPTVVEGNHNIFTVGKRNALKTNTNYTVKISEKIVGIGVAFESEGTLNLTMSYDNNVRTGIQRKESPSQAVYVNVANNVGSINKTFEIMLNEGSEALPWEKYSGEIPSPNPKYPQPIEVSGESYNLLPYPYYENTNEGNGISWVVNDDNTVTANGTATAIKDFFFVGIDKPITLKAGSYILSGCPSGGKLDTTYFLLLGKVVNVTTTTRIASDIGNGATFTLEEDTQIYLLARFMPSTTAENLTFKPMIRKASVKNDRYMPYGKGSVEVKSVGKNVFKHLLISQTVNGVTITVDETIKASGTTTTELTKYLFNNTNNPIVSDKNGLFIKGAKTLTGMAYRAKIVKEDGAIDWTQIGTNGYYVKPNSKIEQIYIQCNNSGTSVSVEIEPQIVEGNVDLPYEPYKETLSTIPTENGLAGIKVSSNGNYTDQNGQQWICDEVVKYGDGSGAYIQRIKTELLTSELNWLKSKSTVGRYLLEFVIKQNVSPLCTHFKGEGKIVDGLGFVFNNAGVQICFNTEFETIEEWKTWVDANEVYVSYALLDEITTPLTAEEIAEIEKLHTFYPVTNISNDFDCGMSVMYYCDSKNYISNQLAIMKQEQEEAMANMLLLMPTEVQATMIENDTNDLLKESEI